MTKKNQAMYTPIIEEIFFAHYKKGVESFTFNRTEITRSARKLKIKLPKNLGDVIYSFRFRGSFPASIIATAPRGFEWIIRLAGKAVYQFAVVKEARIVPNPSLVKTKIPDATPGIVTRYSLADEQALLAKIRYNRLIDIFSGVTCYSLQNHLRTALAGKGQVETDEIYVGVDKHGAHYVFTVQAKGGTDKIGVGQIEQDFAVCEQKFPDLIRRPIAAQFIDDRTIALFEFTQTSDGIRVAQERHYLLVPPDELSSEELTSYRSRSFSD